jgi:hypothetical protein
MGDRGFFFNSIAPGTDVMILKIFLPRKFGKKSAFFAPTTASFCQKLYHNIVHWEKRQFLSKIA